MKTPVKTLALALSLLSPLVSLSTQALPQGSELKAGAAVWNLLVLRFTTYRTSG